MKKIISLALYGAVGVMLLAGVMLVMAVMAIADTSSVQAAGAILAVSMLAALASIGFGLVWQHLKLMADIQAVQARLAAGDAEVSGADAVLHPALRPFLARIQAQSARITELERVLGPSASEALFGRFVQSFAGSAGDLAEAVRGVKSLLAKSEEGLHKKLAVGEALSADLAETVERARMRLDSAVPAIERLGMETAERLESQLATTLIGLEARARRFAETADTTARGLMAGLQETVALSAQTRQSAGQLNGLLQQLELGQQEQQRVQVSQSAALDAVLLQIAALNDSQQRVARVLQDEVTRLLQPLNDAETSMGMAIAAAVAGLNQAEETLRAAQPEWQKMAEAAASLAAQGGVAAALAPVLQSRERFEDVTDTLRALIQGLRQTLDSGLNSSGLNAGVTADKGDAAVQMLTETRQAILGAGGAGQVVLHSVS